MYDLLTIVLLATLVITIVLGGWCVAERYQRLAAFENQLDRLRAEIESLSVERDGLKSAGDALQSDPVALEAAVRERLGYIREGEVIVRVVAEPQT